MTAGLYFELVSGSKSAPFLHKAAEKIAAPGGFDSRFG